MLEGSGPAHIDPSAIAGLGGVQYGLTGRKQEMIRRIQELQQQLAPAKEHDANEPVPMEIGTITGEDGRRDDGSQASQSTKTPKELFFMDPDHEEMRISEEPEVQNYWEAGLTTESLSALKTVKVDHSYATTAATGATSRQIAQTEEIRTDDPGIGSRSPETGRHP